MKKMLSILLAMAMMLSLLPTATYAASADDTKFSLTVSKTNIAVGDTVDVTINIAENPGIAAADIELTWPNGAFEVVSSAANSNFSANSELNGARIVFGALATDTTTTGEFYTVTLKALSAGNHDLSMTGYVANATPEEWDPTFVGATVSVSEAAPTGYTVSLANSSTELVLVGGAVALNVNVNNAFNSAKITLSYDTNCLTFVNGTVASGQTMGEKDQAVSITGENGEITIIDYGTAFAAGNAYTLNFTAAAGTTGTPVTVTYAGLSTEEKAAVEDLTVATSLGTVSVPVGYTVTVPAATDDYTFTASANTVVPGGSVDITVNNPYYDYELTATGGTPSATESGWTVSNVTGNVVVSVTSATPKSFNVTVKTVDKDGNAIDGIDDVVTSNGATYGTNYSYTLPNDTAAGLNAGVQYTLKSITVGGNTATYSTTDRTYTIDGKNVTDDIVVTITKQDLDPNAFTVSMEGETSAGTLEATQVAKDGTAKLTLTNKEAGYTYTVTATMGGSPVTPTQSDDVYTVSNVIGNVVFTISKTLDTKSLNVSEYVQLDGKTMWLVKVGSAQITGKTYTYKASEEATAENFFWSSKYGAYCYLIITDTNTDADTVKANLAGKIGLTGTAAVAINYNGNVNLTTNNSTAVIDVNDAQLVWNMYSAVYSEFTDNVTVQKFLEADMDFSGKLSTNDAAKVVNLIG